MFPALLCLRPWGLSVFSFDICRAQSQRAFAYHNYWESKDGSIAYINKDAASSEEGKKGGREEATKKK